MTLPPLSNDSPLQKNGADELGFEPFSSALARSIAGQPAGQRLAIGLNGEWGMGKTSAMNLMLGKLEALESTKGNAEKTIVVSFSPWLYSGRDDLIRAFFETLEQEFEKPLGAKVSCAVRGVLRSLNKKSRALWGYCQCWCSYR